MTSVLLLFPIGTYGAMVSLVWDSNSEPGLAGYNIYYGTASGDYSHSIDVGDTTEYTVMDLDDGGTYYFAATACDQDDNESAYSEELVYTCSYGKPKPPPPEDSDGDGVPDDRDDFCFDPNETTDTDGDGLGNNADSDDDNDGMPDTWEIQHDLDLLIDDASEDPDGDGINNLIEYLAGTDPKTFEDPSPEDSDGDGVPDDRDDFCFDPNETTDTDGDGLGNKADSDDDNDGMPDIWEIQHGLDSLIDDASEDSDGDGVSNLIEYKNGTDPNVIEDLVVPDAPVLLAPFDDEIVSQTPALKTDFFYDSDANNLHADSQWQIFRADDNFCVYDIMSSSALTSLTVPELILEADVAYIWRVRFFNNRGGASDWSADGSFKTDFATRDLDGNGIPDHQEVDATLDLDQDGVMDREQDDIKCIDTGTVQIGLSIRDADNLDSCISLEIEDPDDEILALQGHGGPAAVQFGLLSFKLRVKAPGDETRVTIYLSRAAADNGKWYKYDPVNAEWMDYFAYIEFGADRKVVYLSLKDGGFGDADGIENGIIVDPLAFGLNAESDTNSHAVGPGDPTSSSGNSCFISTAASRPDNGQSSKLLWHEFQVLGLSIFLVLMLFFGCLFFGTITNKKVV